MNDKHVTEVLPESFHDKGPQRMCLHSGRYRQENALDILYNGRCHEQSEALYMKDRSLISISYLRAKITLCKKKKVFKCMRGSCYFKNLFFSLL